MTLDPAALNAITDRLKMLVDRHKLALQAGRPANDVQLVPRPFDMSKPIRARFDVQTAEQGIALAIWTIGDTLGHLGGLDLMEEVADRLHARFGGVYGAALNARWNGAAGLWHS